MRRAAAVVVAIAGRFVPAGRRATWLREWRGELDAARRAGRSPMRLALGAFADARTVRAVAAAEGASPHARHRRLGGGAVMREAPFELRRAARTLTRSPGFTLASVVTLGVGLAGTAAIFTVVDAVLLRPLPYPYAERLVRVEHVMGEEGGTNPLTRETLLHFQERTRAFEAVGGYRAPVSYTLSGEVQAEEVEGASATAALLDIVGARAVVGRIFTEADDRPGAPAVVVLGHGLWQRRFGADPSVVGRSILVDGRPRDVIGVMAEGVHLPGRRVALWVPEAIDPAAQPSDMFRMSTLARLAPGKDLAAARADVERLTASMPEEVAPFFQIYIDQFDMSTRVRPLRDVVVGDVARTLWILLGAVGIVLVVAVANAANLALVRTEGRRAEVAVRSALGAPRRRLLAHFLAESALVSAAAAVLAILVAGWGVRLLTRLAPPTSLPRLEEISLGGPTVLLVAALSLAVAVALGVYPYVRFGRAAAGGLSPRGASGRADRGQAATGDALVVAQVGLALVLLAGSALLLRSFHNLRAVDLGFSPDAVLVADLALPEAGYPTDETVTSFLARLTERVEALPAARDAAVGTSPMGLGGCSGLYSEGMLLPDGAYPPCFPMTRIGSGWFELLDVPVLAGRTFTPADVRDQAPVAVVSETLAERLWPGRDPLGRGVRPAPRNGPPWYRVIGVVGDVRSGGPDAAARAQLYLPPVMTHDPWGPLRSVTLLVAVEPGAAAAVAPALRAVVSEMDADVPVSFAGNLDDQVARSMVRTSFTLFLLGSAAATGLILGLVGLYGVVAYRVGTRRAEFAVRMALGADGGAVRRTVMRRSLLLVTAGAAVGLLAAAFGTRLLESLLFGVEPGDPWTLAAATAALFATAAAAAWIPARRATQVDPASSLRAE